MYRYIIQLSGTNLPLETYSTRSSKHALNLYSRCLEKAGINVVDKIISEKEIGVGIRRVEIQYEDIKNQIIIETQLLEDPTVTPLERKFDPKRDPQWWIFVVLIGVALISLGVIVYHLIHILILIVMNS